MADVQRALHRRAARHAAAALLAVAGLGCGVVYGVGCGSSRDAPLPPEDTYTAVTVQYAHDGQITPLAGARVTSSFFDSTPVAPLLGRRFADEDFANAERPVAVVSHAFWQDELGGEPGTIGRSIDLDGRGVIVVGVMPQGFEVPPGARVWVPDTSDR